VSSSTLREARDALAAARAWLEELHEAGLEEFPAAGPERDGAAPELPAPAPRPAQAPASVPPQPAQTGSSVAQPAQPAPSTAPDAPLLEPIGDFGRPVTLEGVRAALGECTRCRLSAGRGRIVFGDGDPQADLMFIGEGPGAEEDRCGLPFVGRAGELLTSMIEKGLGIARGDVYICNIVKCRPPENRTPLADEVSTCRPFLDGQIQAVQPKVIIALGKPATSLLLGRDVPITKVRGTWHDYRGIPLMPTLHPAYVLRQYTAENRRNVWDDLKAALTRAQSQP
jgi:uracil-DNA glycosylase